MFSRSSLVTYTTVIMGDFHRSHIWRRSCSLSRVVWVTRVVESELVLSLGQRDVSEWFFILHKCFKSSSSFFIRHFGTCTLACWTRALLEFIKFTSKPWKKSLSRLDNTTKHANVKTIRNTILSPRLLSLFKGRDRYLHLITLLQVIGLRSMEFARFFWANEAELQVLGEDWNNI